MIVLNTEYKNLIRAFLCVFLICSCQIYLAAGAESAENGQLNKLETKLFQHTFVKEEPDSRISRLEKLIFGESKKGTEQERISALVKAVPNLDSPSLAVDSRNESIGAKHEATDEKHAPNKSDSNKKIAAEPDQQEEGSIGNYPAVSAMEKKLFGKEFPQEPIKNRLAQLEKKAFGSVSESNDLSERVDKLKSATGIDIARKPGSVNDWIEEDEDMMAQSHSGQPSLSSDLAPADAYNDLQSAYNSDMGLPYPASTRNPFYSPYAPRRTNKKAPTVSIKSFGISQQVMALEHEMFGKSYEHDPLPARVNRLETSVFPGQKPNVDKPLPERVQILLSKVPIRQEELQHLAKIYNIQPDNAIASADASLDDPNDMASIQRSRSNLHKIMNSLGNMLSGGMAGGYSMQGGNYVTDPASGLLIDPNTGYVVNPSTATMYGGMPYGGGGIGNYGYNMVPFGMGGGMGGGFGGMGMGFGFR